MTIKPQFGHKRDSWPCWGVFHDDFIIAWKLSSQSWRPATEIDINFLPGVWHKQVIEEEGDLLFLYQRSLRNFIELTQARG